MTINRSPDMSVTLAGVKMRNPIGVGAIGSPFIRQDKSTPRKHADVLLKDVKAGAGFICVPGGRYIPPELLAELKSKAKPFQYRGSSNVFKFMRIETEGIGTEGLFMAASIVGSSPEKAARRFQEYNIEIVKLLKQDKPADVPIIANVHGLGAFPESFVGGAVAHEQAGTDLIEINASVALAAGIEGGVDDYFDKSFPLYSAGVLVGDQPELIEAIVRKVAQAVSIPVGVKLSPETGFPRIIDMARRIKNAGGKFINCSNNAVVIAPPDIYNRGKSKWQFLSGNPFAAGSGSWLRQIIYKQIATIAKYVPDIDLIASGGITCPEHVIEAMMLGAKATQTVTEVLYQGRSSIRRQKQFLARYMTEQGYNSPEEFVRAAQEYIIAPETMDFKQGKMFAVVDSLKCTGCGRCVDHVCLAMTMEDTTARVIVDDCLGCGMCVALCPEGAVSLDQKA